MSYKFLIVEVNIEKIVEIKFNLARLNGHINRGILHNRSF